MPVDSSLRRRVARPGGWLTWRFAAQFSTTTRTSRSPWPTGRRCKGDVAIKVFNEHLGSAGRASSRRCKGFAIVCAMRERTRVPARGDRGAAGAEASDHDRNAQRLDRPRGGEGARRRRLRHALVSAIATAAIATGLMLDLARHISYEHARAQGRRALADHDRPRSRRHDAGAPRPRQARHPHGRDRPGLPDERHRLEPEPHAGDGAGRLASSTCDKRRPVPPRRFPLHPSAIVGAHARAGRRARTRPDEADAPI